MRWIALSLLIGCGTPPDYWTEHGWPVFDNNGFATAPELDLLVEHVAGCARASVSSAATYARVSFVDWCYVYDTRVAGSYSPPEVICVSTSEWQDADSSAFAHEVGHLFLYEANGDMDYSHEVAWLWDCVRSR